MAYIGTSPSNGVRRVHTYTATASQTTFSGASSEGVTLSYADTNYLDVYQNGILLGSADYTATSGTSVVLAQAASASDLVVIVVYDVFSVADTVSKANGGTFDNGITIDEDGATVLTVDRATSDGAIIDLQKDGSAVGSIGSLVSGRDLHVNSTGGILTLESNFNSTERQVVLGDSYFGVVAGDDNAVDLGRSSARYKNLYLSGGAYLGGTGSANYLDDYEEGSFSFSAVSSGYTISAQSGLYTKIGRLVLVDFTVTFSAVSSSNANMTFTGLPFNTTNQIMAGVVREATNTGAIYVLQAQASNNLLQMNSMDGVVAGSNRTIRTGENYNGTITYMTDA